MAHCDGEVGMSHGSRSRIEAMTLAVCAALVMCCFACSSPQDGRTGAGATAGGAPSSGKFPLGVRNYGDHTKDAKLSAAQINFFRNLLAQPGSVDEYVAQVVADGVISAREMNEADSRMLSCMARAGLHPGKDFDFGKDGGSALYPHASEVAKDPDETMTRCSFDSGWQDLQKQYDEALRDPTGVDEEPYLFQCYKDKGLLPEDSTYDQYRDGAMKLDPALQNPDNPHYRDVWDCVADPFHNGWMEAN